MTPRALTVLVTVAVAIILFALYLGPGERNLDYFPHFGSGPAQHVLADEELGSPVMTPEVQGWDGQEYWVVAHDPLFLHPERYQRYLPNDTTRLTRVGYPLLVWPFGVVGGARGLMVGLLVVNLAAIALATWSAAKLAVGVGVSATVSLVYVLNPGVTTALEKNLTDVLAGALVLAAVLAMQRSRWALAVAIGTAAVLTREAAFLSLLGVAVLARDVPWKARAGLVVVPLAVYAPVALHIRQFGESAAADNITLIPFRGFVDAWRFDWSVTGSIPSGILSILIGAGCIALGIFCLRRRTLIGAAAAPVLLYVPFMSGLSVRYPGGLLRLVACGLTLAAIDVMAARTRPPKRVAALARPT